MNASTIFGQLIYMVENHAWNKFMMHVLGRQTSPLGVQKSENHSPHLFKSMFQPKIGKIEVQILLVAVLIEKFRKKSSRAC